MIPGFEKELRDLEIAMALVDIARAAQAGLAQLDHEGLGVADWKPLAAAVDRWLELTGQTNGEGAVT